MVPILQDIFEATNVYDLSTLSNNSFEGSGVPEKLGQSPTVIPPCLALIGRRVASTLTSFDFNRDLREGEDYKAVTAALLV